jgi:hypothetical protein
MSNFNIDTLNAMKPLDILSNEEARTRFINLHCHLRGKTPEDAEAFYEQEKFYLSKLIVNNEDLKACSGFSVYCVLTDIASNGISVDPSLNLAYVLWRSSKNGTGGGASAKDPKDPASTGAKTTPRWQKQAYIQLTAYGELSLRVNAGQLLYADHPVMVYEGDTFRPMIGEHGKVIVYEGMIPRRDKKIIAGFVRTVRPDHSADYFWMDEEDIDRLRAYSAKKNGDNGANSNYTKINGGIDPGFFRAKLILHALKALPPVPHGRFTVYSDDPVQASDYGLDEPVYEAPGAPEPAAPGTEPEPGQTAPVQPADGFTVDDPDEAF